MRQKWPLTLLLIILVFSTVLSGCNFTGSKTTTSNKEESKSSNTNTSPKVLNWSIENDIPNLNQVTTTDGISFRILNNIMEGLYRQNDKHEAVPAMAKGVDISEDKLTYTFHLRDNIQWSNGQPVTAKDFKYAWLRAIHPGTAGAYAFVITDYIAGAKAYSSGKGSEDAVGIEVKDDKTLVVKLVQPTPYFLKLTAFITYLPLNQKFVEEKGTQFALTKDDLLFNGPYLLTSYDQKVGVVLEKNPKYWDHDNVDIDKANIKVVKEQSTALNLYEAGNLDRVDLSSSDVKKYQGSPEFHTESTFTTHFIQFNLSKPEMANKNIRQALQLAYDPKILSTVILNNGSVAATGLIPPQMTGLTGGKSFREAQGDVITTNIQQAKDLWAKGVQELGGTPNLELLTADDTLYKDTATFLQSEYKKNLGIDVKIVTKPNSGRLQAMRENDYQFAVTRWGADYNDGLSFLNEWKGPAKAPRGNYNNPKYDQLVNQAASEKDEQKRLNMLLEAERILVKEDAAVAPLFYLGKDYLLKPYITQMVVHPYGASLELKYFKMKK